MGLFYYVYRITLSKVLELKNGQALPAALTISNNLDNWIYLPFIAMVALTLAVALGLIKNHNLWIVFTTLSLGAFILWSMMAAVGLGAAFMPLVL